MIDTWFSSAVTGQKNCEDLRRRYLADPARIMVVDNVLQPDRYALLSRGLREDCSWDTRHGVHDSTTEWVSTEKFAEAPEERRMFRHGAFGGALKGREMSPGMLGLVRFKLVLESPAFGELLESLTGRRVNSLQEMLLRRMTSGDMARPHDDAIEARKLCMLLYFTDGWTADHGGRFVLHASDGDRHYEPYANRMILFDVGVKQNHSVEALRASSSGETWRYNFSIWFN